MTYILTEDSEKLRNVLNSMINKETNTDSTAIISDICIKLELKIPEVINEENVSRLLKILLLKEKFDRMVANW